MDTFIINTHGSVLPGKTIDMSILARFRDVKIVAFAPYGRLVYSNQILPLMRGITVGGDGFIRNLISTLLVRSEEELVQTTPSGPYLYNVIREEDEERLERTDTYRSQYARLINNVIRASGITNIALFDKDSIIPDMSFSYNKDETDILISNRDAQEYNIPVFFTLNSTDEHYSRKLIPYLPDIERWKDDHPRHLKPAVFNNRMNLKLGVYFYSQNAPPPDDNVIPFKTISRNIIYYDNIASNEILRRSNTRNRVTLSEFIQSIPNSFNDRDIFIVIGSCKGVGRDIIYPYMYERPADEALLDRLSSIMISEGEYVERRPSMFSLQNPPQPLTPAPPLSAYTPGMRRRRQEYEDEYSSYTYPRSVTPRYRMSRRPIYPRRIAPRSASYFKGKIHSRRPRY